MAEMQYRTKNNTTPVGKPRVYFTCHPEDFEICFDKICQDIFRTHDCAIYYTENMAEAIPEEDRETDLGSHNLFVIPVTRKLLTDKNRAMDSDFFYAKEHDIPVLPFMFESGLDAIYARADKFDKMQYLSPLSTDSSEIKYQKKLKDFLDKILISDETANEVRRNFNAYIFLSYRKKDRRHANKLMSMIHEIPEFRDIAIWYDEFLTPGESYQENIEKNLKESKLFALLVTPSILEETDGKPNFVMGEEYPAAKKNGMKILPVEMVTTDQKTLKKKYDGIKKCVNPYKERAFQKQLSKAAGELTVHKSRNNPKHLYLMGLAYYEGIDVELNRQRGMELLYDAAESGWEDAIVKLKRLADAFHDMGNYQKSAELYKKVQACCHKKYGKDNISTLAAMSNLALEYIAMGNYYQALMLQEPAYAAMASKLGEQDPKTLSALHNLASIYHHLGQHQKSFELRKRVYALRCAVLGENHPTTLASLHNLASTYSSLGKYREALPLQEKAYALQCASYGAEHPDSLSYLHALALSYKHLGEYQKAVEAEDLVYRLRCQTSGEEHPETLNALHNLATFHKELGNREAALKLLEKAYDSFRQSLGEEHPNTLSALNSLAMSYQDTDLKKALLLQEKAYTLMCKVLGEAHPHTIGALLNLASLHLASGDRERCLKMQYQAYHMQCESLGKEHPNTLTALSNLAYTYRELGNLPKALELLNQVYDLRCKTLGDDHADSLDTLSFMTMIYESLEDYQECIRLLRILYVNCQDEEQRNKIAKQIEDFKQRG